MSDPVNTAFVSMASAHINQANKDAEAHGHELSGIALTHAAARYNAFLLSIENSSKGKLNASRDEFVAKAVDQYREFLNHHYDEYAKAEAENA
ncbi:MAG: DUF3144 domain-containing protein [Asticcacaulis sp.]